MFVVLSRTKLVSATSRSDSKRTGAQSVRLPTRTCMEVCRPVKLRPLRCDAVSLAFSKHISCAIADEPMDRSRQPEPSNASAKRRRLQEQKIDEVTQEQKTDQILQAPDSMLRSLVARQQIEPLGLSPPAMMESTGHHQMQAGHISLLAESDQSLFHLVSSSLGEGEPLIDPDATIPQQGGGRSDEPSSSWAASDGFEASAASVAVAAASAASSAAVSGHQVTQPQSQSPEPYDCLFGRGKKHRHHPGNRRMLQIVSLYRQEYVNANRAGKRDISRNIVHIIKTGHRAGRFLKQDEQTGNWGEVSDEVARHKIGHAIRDGHGKDLQVDPETIQEVTLFETRRQESFRELEDDARFLMEVYGTSSSSGSDEESDTAEESSQVRGQP